MGRRSKWPEVESRFAEIEIWLREGLFEEQICKKLGIGVTTWETYKNKFPQLLELLKKGRNAQNIEVENSLFKAATGYYYKVDEAIKVKDAQGNESVQVVSLSKFKGPDTGAMCFWLKNRKSREWADNPQMLEIKRQELAIREKESDFKQW